jgi:rubrerythrin
MCTKVAAEYDHASEEIEEPGLQKLLVQIRDHEASHAAVFTDLLKKQDLAPLIDNQRDLTNLKRSSILYRSI